MKTVWLVLWGLIGVANLAIHMAKEPAEWWTYLVIFGGGGLFQTMINHLDGKLKGATR